MGDIFTHKQSPIHRHDNQEIMGEGSPLPVPPPPPLASSPSGYTLCPTNRCRGLTRESPSTSLGSVVTANLGGTDTFEGHSNTVYRNCLQAVQPSAASDEYASFINAKVADHENGVWTTDIVQCLHQGILPSRTRTLTTDIILTNKSQSFSIVWADDTDSICDLPLLLTYLDNDVSKRHRAEATRSPVTGGRARSSIVMYNLGVGHCFAFVSASARPQNIYITCIYFVDLLKKQKDGVPPDRHPNYTLLYYLQFLCPTPPH
jgi:hypothetical protein